MLVFLAEDLIHHFHRRAKSSIAPFEHPLAVLEIALDVEFAVGNDDAQHAARLEDPFALREECAGLARREVLEDVLGENPLEAVVREWKRSGRIAEQIGFGVEAIDV